MKSVYLAAAATFALAGIAFGQSTAPAGSAAMPPGHPPMSGAVQPAGALPPNHPSMDGPPQPAGALPPNHPSMADILKANPNPGAIAGAPGAATRPAVTIGSLTITALPGTAGAPPIKDETVTVDLYHRGSPLKKIERKLDAEGKVTFPDLPVMPPVQALISITHGGLLQQIVTPELNSENPNPSLQMKVFETTEEAPAWTVAMQHLIIQWTADGSAAQVTEMISASSPIDRAWLGTKSADNKRTTLTIALPPDADQLELGGSFDDEASHLVDGKLVTGSALFPGRSEFRLSYLVPAKNGNVELPISSPAAVGTLVVFLPADDTQVTATGLTGGDPVDMGQGKIRMFKAQGLQAGAIANLSIKGIKATPVEEHDVAPVAASKFSPRNLAMAGAFVVVLAGIALMFMKKNPNKAST